MRIEIAYPIHQLSQYAICSMSATQPLEVHNHNSDAQLKICKELLLK